MKLIPAAKEHCFTSVYHQRRFRMATLDRSLPASYRGCHDALVAVVILLFATAWYRPFTEHHVMMGDDVHIYDYLHDPHSSFATKCLFSAPWGKYRPAYTALGWLQVQLFGGNYQLYVWFNILMYAGITYLLYRLIMQVSQADVLASLSLALIFLTSRFAFFHISEVFGLLEQLCLLWSVLIGQALYLAYRHRSLPMYGAASLCFFFLVYTHERFMACAPFFVVILWWTDWLSVRAKMLLCAAFLAPSVVNVLIKTAIFATPVLKGTGGKDISLEVDRIAVHATEAILSVLGINKGPAYLTVADFASLPWLYKVAGMLAAGTIGGMALAFWLKRLGRPSERSILAGTTVLLGCLIAGASITIRLEQRWLLVPQLVLLVYLGHASRAITSAPLRVSAILCLAFSSMLLSRFFVTHRNDMYLFHSRAIADAFYDASVKRFGCSTKTLYVKQFDAASWVISPEHFFSQFDLPSPTRMHLYERDEDLKLALADPNGVAVLELRSGKPFVFLDTTWAKAAALNAPPMVYDCYAEFPRAEIDCQKSSSFPWGESIVRLEPPVTSAPAIFMGGGSIRYTLQLPDDGELYLKATVEYLELAKSWHVSDGAIVTAKVAVGDKQETIFSIPIEPTSESQSKQSSLAAFRGQRIQLELILENPDGKTMDGDWVVVTGLGVVAR